MAELLFKEEVYNIVGAAMEVHRIIGPEFLEPVYHESFAIELNQAGIEFFEEVQVPIKYKNISRDHPPS